MVVFSVSYPVTEGTHFDLTYYMQTHMRLVRERFSEHGLEQVRLIRGTSGVAGGALGESS